MTSEVIEGHIEPNLSLYVLNPFSIIKSYFIKLWIKHGQWHTFFMHNDIHYSWTMTYIIHGQWHTLSLKNLGQGCHKVRRFYSKNISKHKIRKWPYAVWPLCTICTREEKLYFTFNDPWGYTLRFYNFEC